MKSERMASYVAVVWNAKVPSNRESARRMIERLRLGCEVWHAVVEEEGLTVCCLEGQNPFPDRAHPLGAGRGVVLGTLFDGSGRCRTLADAGQADAIVASKGQFIVRQFWGRYVAFIRDPRSGDVQVIRDPSGGIPCQWMRMNGVDVYFERLEDADRLGSLPTSIDMQFLIGYLLYDSVRREATGIAGIESVTAGERISHEAGRRTRSLAWNAMEFAKGETIEDRAVAVQMTRETTETCVQAWASQFDRMALMLSGGLDSAIVLACLEKASPSLLCINDYIEAASSADERVYARLAASRAGRELIERQPSRAFNLDGLRSFPRAVCPHPCLDWSEAGREQTRFMRNLQVRAVFDGNGGDELFGNSGRLPTAIDHAWLHGLQPPLASIAADDAEYLSVSYWSVLRAVWRYGVLQMPWDPRRGLPADYRPLVAADVRASAPPMEHFLPRYFQSAPHLPPGKLIHLRAITGHSARIHIPRPDGKAWARISPLSSQPLMELCLRIPMPVLYSGGRDRSIARSAFENVVPEEIVYRRTKGSGGELIRHIVTQNLSTLREFLLDGYLVHAGLLDRAATEEALSGRPTRLRSFDLELLHYLNIEAWAHAWTRHRGLRTSAKLAIALADR
jgi:asparagine synthase (glutamine-hydrolysing)